MERTQCQAVMLLLRSRCGLNRVGVCLESAQHAASLPEEGLAVSKPLMMKGILMRDPRKQKKGEKNG